MMGRIENLLQTSETENWPDKLGYESLCKAYCKGHMSRSSMQRNYRELIDQGPMSRFINTKSFSMHLITGSIIPMPRQFNFSYLENQTQQVLSQFDQQSNFTMEMVKNYEYYKMQVRHFDSLLLHLMDQQESITDENKRMRLFRTMTTLSNKVSTAEGNQLSIRSIIKRHVRTLRSDLEWYYVLKIIQQSLSTLDTIIDLHQDIIYEHQFHNGKIISFRKFRNVDPITTTEELTTTQTITATTTEQATTTSLSKTTEATTTTISTTTQTEIDWEKVNELDEQESERDTGIFTPILSNIVNTLMTIGSTIVYGVYQICTSSNSTIHNNVVTISS